MNRYCPWRHLASRPDITFGITRLPVGDGWWLPDERAIVLGDHLDRIGRRTTLTHELVHAEREDTNVCRHGPDGPRLARRQEVAADRISASRLVTLEQLATALAWARAPEEAAAELDVTVPVLRRRLAMLTTDEVLWVEEAITTNEGAA